METSQKFLLFEGPNVNIWVFATNCKKRVVGAQSHTDQKVIVFEGEEALSCVPLVCLANIEELDSHIHAQGDYESKTRLTSRRRIIIAPLEVSDGTFVIIQAHYRIGLFWRPDENAGVI